MKKAAYILSFYYGYQCLPLHSCVKLDIQEDYNVSPELTAIDTLMWHHPDSALAVMMEFAASPKADSLDVYNGHYCQVLIAELSHL